MTLRVRRVENGDVPFGRQLYAYAQGGEAAVQNVATTLKFLYGEWVFDRTKGIDYLGQILKKGASEVTSAAIVQAAIVGADGVQKLTAYSYQMDRTTRRLSISATVQTIDGLQTWAGVLP